MDRLLDVIREPLGLTGTKEGCGEGECGACSIVMNGRVVNSCLVPAIQAQAASITTIEGVASDKLISKIQKAFLEHGGAQCGICTPGMIIAATDLLKRNSQPTLDQIRTGLSGNLCRCTGYTKIFDSVASACQAENK
jgi:carbon-monoxide dehydrogenase small subunit